MVTFALMQLAEPVRITTKNQAMVDLIRQRIGDNKLRFIPEATREEAEGIATGLTNIGRKMNPLETKW